MPLFTTDGHLTDEGLSVYVEALKDDNLDALDPLIPAHVQSCLDCHRQAVDLYALIRELDRAAVISRPAAAPRLRRIRWIPWAAAAALAGVLFFALHPWDRQEGPPLAVEQQEAPGDTVVHDPAPHPGSKERDLAREPRQEPDRERPKREIENDPSPAIALAFQPNEHLENVIGEMTRGGDFSVKSPEPGENFRPGADIKFEWEGAESGLEIVILNNQDEILSREKAEGRSLTRQVPATPGLYYWKLETEDDLIYVGKFLVK